MHFALRVVIAQSDSYFDVLVAKQLAPDALGTVGGFVAGSGVPVGWHMAPFSGHITAPWVFEQRSELLLVGIGPLLGTALVGLFVAATARVLALPKWPLLAASAGSYAVLAGFTQMATRDPGAAMELSTSTFWTVAAAAGWALAVGGAVVRFYPEAGQRSARAVRAARQRAVQGAAVTAVVAVVASMLSVSTAEAAPAHAQTLQKWRPSGVSDALKDLQTETGHKLHVADNPQTGTPSTLGGLRSRLTRKDVPAWLHAHARLFGVADTDDMLTKVTDRVQLPDPSGAKHVWYDQSIHGVPVYNARLGVHLNAGSTTVTAVTNGLRPDLIPPASTDPTVSQKDAVAVAGKTMQHAKTTASPSLVVYPGSPRQGFKSPSALAWQIDETDKNGFSERIFVDALHKGVIAGVQPLTETAAAAGPNPPSALLQDATQKHLAGVQPLTETAEDAVPDPPRALPQNATDNDLKWQPDTDYDTDSCYNVPAIGPDGTISQGLEHKNVSLTSDCRDQSDLDNTNAYSRQRCNLGWCVYLYDYYTEKDVAVPFSLLDNGHTHDWEHVAVWVKDDKAEYVSTSAHGKWNVHPASEVIWDGTHPKVVFHKDGGLTHNFRLANAGDEPPENFYHTWRRSPLVSYNGFPNGLRDKLFAADFGEATIAIKDSTFADNIEGAIPTVAGPCTVTGTGQTICDPPVSAFPFLPILDDGSPGTPSGPGSTPRVLYRTIFDMKHQANISAAVRVREEGDPATSDDEVNDAYDESGVVYNYYKDKFGRNSIDGDGMELKSYVHDAGEKNNASWNGEYMAYGDGMLSQDVTGHEMTHGVTQYTAGLQYAFESGALNESISDFFGEMTERYATGRNDWLVGSDINIGPVRSMADPTVYDQPRHMSAYDETCMDNGGVHTNSGIPNYAFYRMSVLMDPDTTTSILWRAMTQYLSPTSTFADAETAMVTAATDLYGPTSRQASVTTTVWENEVGITPSTPDPRPEGCAAGGISITCSTLQQVYGNSGALTADGSSLEDVGGSLVHMYELGTVSESPAVTYYETLFLENRDDFDDTLNLNGPLLDQFVKTVQTLAPVFQAVGTDQADTVIVTQDQIDSAGAFKDAVVTAANEQGKTHLAQLIPQEWDRVDAQHLVGLSVNGGLHYLDTIAEKVPTSTPGQAAPSLASTFNNVSVTQDTATNIGDIDGGGASFSAQALAAAGVTPGSTVSHRGVALTWPSTAGTGKADNTVASGQTIALSGTGDSLGFLVSASYGPAGGNGTISYSDGTSQQFSLNSPDWFGGDGDVAISTAYQNRQGNQKYQGSAYVYYVGVPLQSGKTPVSVQLPNVSTAATAGAPSLHIWAMARGTGAQDLTSTFNNTSVTPDTNTAFGDMDGGGRSLSAQALAAAGVTPGSQVSHKGLTLTWPSTAGVLKDTTQGSFGQPDNVLSAGQTVAVNGTSGSTLGFLLTSANGTPGGTATIHYSDGTSQQFTLTGTDWFGGSGDTAISSTYQNLPNNQKYVHASNVYYVGVALQAGKTPLRVDLPNVAAATARGVPVLHIYAMTRG
ncbi:NPP1 family protein [Streptomyces sp. MBT84]|uniref:NPP1 family protein n=1 Tax=Streptomyces sp. MBT84 TaxID=1488414 RepID=UPI001C6F02A6|nr:NPP1 family protein [Streptomyces sp. MBT84]